MRQGRYRVPLRPGDVEVDPGQQVRKEGLGVLAHPGAKDLRPDRVNQRLGVWASEGDAAFAQRPSHDLGVAVG